MPKINRAVLASYDIVQANSSPERNGYHHESSPVKQDVVFPYEGGVVTAANCPGFKYRGGKRRLRRQIIRFAKLQGSVYAEPYAGRANMFFLMRVMADFRQWIVNDLQTVDFLRAIVNYSGRELPMISGPSIKKLGGFTTKAYLRHPDQEAVLLLEPIVFWSGGRRGSTTPNGKMEYPNRNVYRDILLKAQALLKGADIRQENACDIISALAGDSEAFLYVDPPYINADVGAYKFSIKDRKRMIDVLSTAKCNWLLSEYSCPDLDKAFGPPIARIYSYGDSGSKIGRSMPTVECLYSNYKAGPAIIDFGDAPTLLPVSKNILVKAGGKADLEKWCRYCPPLWSKQFKSDQFGKVARQPWTYFDGRTIFLI